MGYGDSVESDGGRDGRAAGVGRVGRVERVGYGDSVESDGGRAGRVVRVVRFGRAEGVGCEVRTEELANGE